jgi:hypothetical protein
MLRCGCVPHFNCIAWCWTPLAQCTANVVTVYQVLQVTLRKIRRTALGQWLSSL